MNYIELLKESVKKTGNCACMGLDPQTESLPYNSGNVKKDLEVFFEELLLTMKKKKLSPAAFKPNIGYYSVLDKPRQNDFSGSKALSFILDILEKEFSEIPIILDSKRGDIARSSLNYAIEAFDCWQADAVTVSPYMGSDSFLPFMSGDYIGKGVYILNRTSNPGAKDFQNLKDNEGKFFYEKTASKISEYAAQFPGTGAVVGATGKEELKVISKIYSKTQVPMLIPGVGSQGGKACEVIDILKTTGYDLSIARINSSSTLTHPWKNSKPPKDFLDHCISNIQTFLNETKII